MPASADLNVQPMRIAIQLQPQRCSFAELRRAAASFEELGVDMLLTWDHFFPMYGPENDRTYECWTTLASWAEVTTTVEIGPLVSCVGYRNPHLTADMARTIDHISDGRFVLGLGAGWSQRDFEEYEFGFGSVGERMSVFERGLDTIQYRLGRLDPPPVRRIPILIGGNGERRTLRMAAKHAGIWHGFGDVQNLARLHAVLDAHCAAIGRDPAEIERSTRILNSSPEVDGEALAEIGTRLFTLVGRPPDFDSALTKDWLAFRDDFNSRHVNPVSSGEERRGPK